LLSAAQRLLFGVSELHHLEQKIDRLTEKVSELICALEHNPGRAIRLHIASVQFIKWPGKTGNIMDTFSLELPSTGEAARLAFQPKDKNNVSVKIDGAIIPTIQGDPSSAQVAVSPDGLTLDIQLPTTPDSNAVIEVDADADLSPDNKNVITTMVTVRRLAPAVGQAVTLGAQADVVSLIPADQFGVFPASAAKKK
jgi:hypothetical protein